MEGGGKGSRARLVLISSHSFSSDFNMQYMARQHDNFVTQSYIVSVPEPTPAGNDVGHLT